MYFAFRPFPNIQGIVDNSTATTLTLSSETTPVNYFDLKSSATGNAVVLTAQGSDTNIPIRISTKGTGSLIVGTSSGISGATIEITSRNNTYPTSAVPSLSFRQYSASNYGYDFVQDDTVNGNLYLNKVELSVPVPIMSIVRSTGEMTFGGVNGGQSLIVSPVASAVNYLQVQGSTTGNAVTLSAQGSDTNVNMLFSAKGAGNYGFGSLIANAKLSVTNNDAASNFTAFKIVQNDPDNWASEITTTYGISLGSASSSSAVDLFRLTNGASSQVFKVQADGIVGFGTHSAIGAETLTGYITIKDAAGNSRKVGVIS